MTLEDSQQLEAYIEDWHCDGPSHLFAKSLGKYLFEFMDYLRKQDLSQRTLRKHIDNCWCIGYLECGFGYRNFFHPGDGFGIADAPYDDEFRRKFSDSQYAVDSYRATWRKLYSYTKAQGHLESAKAESQKRTADDEATAAPPASRDLLLQRIAKRGVPSLTKNRWKKSLALVEKQMEQLRAQMEELERKRKSLLELLRACSNRENASEAQPEPSDLT